MPTRTASSVAPAVDRVVPFAHVSDVDASVEFYALLGFAPESDRRDPEGRRFWAFLESGRAQLMLARASGAIDHTQQAVLFYMYTPDVGALRRRLIQGGVADAGVYVGQPTPTGGQGLAFAITRPDYMPMGEFRLTDPDGYTILVGQVG